MDVTLPSGHKAVLRDVFQRGDRREAQRGIVVVISPDGSRRLEGSIQSDIAGRIIRRMLVSWDFDGQPTPGQAVSDHLAEGILDALSDDDAEALEKAVRPWTDRVLRVEAAGVFTHVPTGIRVLAASPADSEKLAALPEFSREDDGAPDPKPASAPTAISS
jgi:hypothetical protein